MKNFWYYFISQTIGEEDLTSAVHGPYPTPSSRQVVANKVLKEAEPYASETYLTAFKISKKTGRIIWESTI